MVQQLTRVVGGCATASAADGGTEVIIGTGADYNPYCYLDENNELTGFEKAVLDEIDARLPDYTFSYQMFDFANILLSLESGKIDVAVHQYEYNVERAEKYLYGDVGYTTYPLHLVVRGDDDSIQTFEDLEGKKVISTSTTNNSYYVTNKWNEEHGNPFEIIFASTAQLAVEDLESGVGDAMVLMPRLAESYRDEYQVDIKVVGDAVTNSNAYYLFNLETGGELKEVFDEALAELKADGTLVRLSQEWLGGDYIAKD